MVDDNLILEHLKAIRADMSASAEDMKSVKMRLAEIERGIGMLLSNQAEGYSAQARQQSEIERLSERITRIEKRLEIAD